MTDSLNKSLSQLPPDELEIITLGGGCFWCVEAVFQDVVGVHAVTSGYSGGSAADANYQAVCSGLTRHAEVVQVAFNPKVIGLDQILLMFWSAHDPTTPNRQGNDVGPQYRSVIFFHHPQQQEVAERSKREVATQIWEQPIVTEIAPFETFYPAEEYHQDYYKTVGNRNPYCTFVITPKVAKFRQQFAQQLKPQ